MTSKDLLATFIVMGLVLSAWAIQDLKGAGRWFVVVVIAGVTALLLIVTSHFALARDDGRYAASPLKSWFDALKSGKGLCCSDADGTALSDVDWDARDGHYRVRLEGEWVDVPADAVITEPNRAGRTMVWPWRKDGVHQIRCFMPGSMT